MNQQDREKIVSAVEEYLDSELIRIIFSNPVSREELEQVKIEDEVTDVICEQCGRNMVVKYGPHGKFLACPGFPECKNT